MENIGGEVYFKRSGLSPACKFTMKRPQDGNSFHGFLMLTESEKQNEKYKCTSEPSKMFSENIKYKIFIIKSICVQRYVLL